MKKILVGFMVLLSSLLFASCNAVQEISLNWDDVSKNISDADFQALKNSNSKISVTLWHTMGADNQKLLTSFLEEFAKEYPGIQVTDVAKGGYDDLRDATVSAIRVGTEPNLVYTYPDHVAKYIAANKVLPLNNFIDNENKDVAFSDADKEDFVKAYWDEGAVYDDRKTMLSLPYAKSTEAMFYNKTLFDENGLTAPKTWDEVKEVSKKIHEILLAKGIKQSEIDDKTYVPFGYDSSDNMFITLSEQYKVPYTKVGSTLLSGEILFNNDDSKNMMKEFAEMYKNNYISTRPMMGGNYSSKKMLTGQLFMGVGSTGGTRNNIPANQEFQVGVAQVPQKDLTNQKVIQQGPNLTILKKTGKNEKQNLASWVLLKHLTNAKNSAKWSMETGYSPVRMSSYELPEYKAFLVNDFVPGTNEYARNQVFIDVAKLAQEQAKNYFTSPVFDKSSATREQVGNLITAIFGGTDLDKAFRDAYNKANY